MHHAQRRWWIGLAVIGTLVPIQAHACGFCIDGVIRFHLPFMPWWSVMFLVWFLTRQFAGPDARVITTLRKLMRVVGGTVMTVVLAFLALGSLLFPFFWYFWWWLARTLQESFGASTLELPRWRAISRAGLGIFLMMVIWGYAVTSNDPVWVGSFIDYHGGPVIEAQKRLTSLGKPAVPVILERLLNDNRPEHSKFRDWKDGIRLIETIASRSFTAELGVDALPDGSFDELEIRRRKILDWWKQAQ